MSLPVAGVVGWPVKHSRSPVVHEFWLKTCGLGGEYQLFAVPPEQLSAFFQRIVDGELVGTNVTVPHKQAAFEAVTHRHDAARATGSLNTIWLEDGALVGTNTDPAGFLANLDAAAPGWDSRGGHAVVLGAGGAARGVAWALAGRAFERVCVVNRTLSRAENVAADLGVPVEPVAWSDLETVLHGAGILVNATSLGMAGQDPLVVPLDDLPAHAVVNDIVYTPLETALLVAARRRGLTSVDGLGMLLHQAVLGFERWFGVRPQVTDELRRTVLAAMGQT